MVVIMWVCDVIIDCVGDVVVGYVIMMNVVIGMMIVDFYVFESLIKVSKMMKIGS